MSKKHLQDFELWELIRAGSESAFDVLFKRYWKSLYKLAYSYLKDSEVSKEIVHDVFISIWNRKEDLEIHSFRNFLLTAIRYEIYNRMRSAKLQVVYTPDYADADCLSDQNSGAERIRQQELEQDLNQYLEQLPKRCNLIFQMSRNKHLTNDEIATILGVSKRTVDNQLSLAVKHLKTCYKSRSKTAFMTLFMLLSSPVLVGLKFIFAS
jgi:RNA polymerase sigma-70 factor (ECF subfamily)